MQAPHGAAPNAEPPGAASEAAIAQAAVESFVEQHGAGEAPSPDVFVQRYPEQVRPRILGQIREFLAFDGMLGHQEWEPQATPQSSGRTFGDFVIQEELGRGGMGVVYLAHQKSLNRRVALKVMASGLTLSKRHVERFRREAAAAAQLRHPAMVPVHSFTEVDGTFAFAMDFVAGRNLADVLDDLRLSNGEQPSAIEGTFGMQPEKGYVAECAILCAQLASALAAAHTAGIVHRDMKPRNVMIDERRQARLLDFGLAKSLGEGSISMSGEITGTAHYMSPEQTLAKRVVVDHRADIWALGVILYELLTLQRPFDGKNLQQVVYEICFKEPIALAKRNPKVPRDLVTICGKALEKDPQNRYQTAAEFEADLLRFLSWEPIHAKPAGPVERLTKWVHRHRTETVLATAFTVLAVGLLGYAWYDAKATSLRADELLRLAAQKDEHGDPKAAAETATEARLLRDDATARDRIELYQGHAMVAAKKEEADLAVAATLSLKSNQALARDRDLAVILALAAVDRRASQQSRSAVLDALGNGFRTTTLAGHKGQVLCVRWSPDGRRTVTTGSDGTALLWDAAAGTLQATLRGHEQWVVDAAFHPDGSLLATAGVDRNVRLWRTADGAPAGEWKHDGAVELVRFDAAGDRALTTSYLAQGGPYRAQVWDVRKGTCIATLASHRQHIVGAAISPCGRYVASGGDRGFVRLWDAATGTELGHLGGHDDRERDLAFSPDSSLVAVAATDGGTRLYSVPGAALLATVWHSREVLTLDFDPDSSRLLTGSSDQTVRIWRLQRDLTKGTCAPTESHTLVGHGGGVLHAEFDRSGQLVVTAGRDGVLRVFDASSGRASSGVELMHYEVGPFAEYAAFDADARRVLALAGKQRVVVWDFIDRRGVATLRQPGPVPAACFDATGDRVVTAGDDERVRLWNAHDGRLYWATEKLGNPITALDVDATGENIVCGTTDARVEVLQLADGKRRFSLPGHRARITAARFAANGTHLVTAGGKQAIVWNCKDQSRVQTLDRNLEIVDAALSPDGSLLATIEKDALVARLWRVADGSPQGELTGHREALRCVCFRPDGKAVLTASQDGTARATALDGTLLVQFQVGKGKPLQQAAWNHDGTQILTSSRGDEHQARLWNAADGTELLRFGGHTNTVECGAFSPDGQWAVTASRDGTARVWPTDPVAVARRLPLRTLSESERATLGLDPSNTPR